MHDLNTITRLNAEAHGAAINKSRASGKWVVPHYAGLTLMSFRSFDTREEAIAHRDSPLEGSEHRSVLEPLPSFYPADRDQSEDRGQPYSLDQLAALGARSVGDPSALR